MDKEAETHLEKFKVCAECHSVGIVLGGCVCTYQRNYEVIELEFEVCNCCNNLISDGQCADTPFNEEQFKKQEDDQGS